MLLVKLKAKMYHITDLQRINASSNMSGLVFLVLRLIMTLFFRQCAVLYLFYSECKGIAETGSRSLFCAIHEVHDGMLHMADTHFIALHRGAAT